MCVWRKVGVVICGNRILAKIKGKIFISVSLQAMTFGLEVERLSL